MTKLMRHEISMLPLLCDLRVTICPGDIMSTYVLCEEMSVTKCPVKKCMCDEMTVTKCPVTKCPVTKCPQIFLQIYLQFFISLCQELVIKEPSPTS